MKLATKLFGAFLATCAIGAVVSAIGIRNAGLINDAADTMYAEQLVGLSAVKEANVDLLYIGRALRNGLLAQDDGQRRAALERVDTRTQDLQAQLDKARPLFTTTEGRNAIARVDDQWAAYRDQAAKLRRQVEHADLYAGGDATSLLFGSYAEASNTLDESMSALAAIKEKNAQEASDYTTSVYEAGRASMLVLVFAALGLGLAAGGWLTRSITRQLGTEPETASDLARRVAGGDLTTPIVLRDGDTSSLMAALRAMQQSLTDVVSQVRTNAEGVATASEQIANGNVDLSQRTEEQASALQQTAATMTELSQTVRGNADSASQASQLADSASAIAGRGGAVVGEVIDTMKDIHGSSKRIAEIIGTIDGIAFQTNILALNAAVEAARAGEQGRGFAVVAGEVRALAQRSAEAAREIKTLITDSVEQVEKGSGLVDQAGETMKEVLAAVRRVADIAGEISAASIEQSTGVSQVDQAVGQMDQVTQQNAALVEESAAAAESLRQQARTLVDAVSVFRLSGDTGARRAMAPVPAPTPARTAPAMAAAAPTKRVTAAPAPAPAKAIETSDDTAWETF